MNYMMYFCGSWSVDLRIISAILGPFRPRAILPYKLQLCAASNGKAVLEWDSRVYISPSSMVWNRELRWNRLTNVYLCLKHCSVQNKTAKCSLLYPLPNHMYFETDFKVFKMYFQYLNTIFLYFNPIWQNNLNFRPCLKYILGVVK